MMRLPQGGSDLDRTQALSFSYDGAALSGFAGDTLASALLGNGVRIVGRSFKYHRPRGVISAGIEEPSAILDLRHGSRHDPNARATIEPLAEGMRLSSVHAIGTAARDRLAVIDRFARFIPSAFYYKTFLWPRWMLFEPRIRAMAGLGRLDPEGRSVSEGTRHATVDVCVVGSGPAGLAAALSAAGTGSKVMLVELGLRLGGSLLHRSAEVDGKPGADWAGDAGRRLKAAGVAVLTRAMAFGLYDHNSLAVVERGLPATQGSNGERLWHVRARRIVLATGAIERPLLFGHNDLPGVMLADSALMYLRRYAVRAGSRAVVATGNDSAYETAIALRQAGAEVVVVDSRNASPALEHARAAGIEVRTGAKVETALGSRGVEGVRITDGTTITADLLAVSGGWSPALHLYCQAQGRPRWSDDRSALVPGAPVPGITVVGAANGTWDLPVLLAEGHAAGGGPTAATPAAPSSRQQWTAAPMQPTPSRNRAWVDLQNDVTTKDVALAAREAFTSVEHLKRYTTLGMATDQGKTSNVNGIATLAAVTGRDPAQIGVTTFRPPYAPVSFATIVGRERGELYAPVRRLPAEQTHRDEGAWLTEYGGILRPAWYGPDRSAIATECLAARNGVSVFDGSPLGKIEVIGPDAAALLDFVFYTRMSSLPVGRLRYGLMLTEGGVIFDDGVVLRLAPDRFVVSCSSSHVAAVHASLEEWRQDRFDIKRVFIHDTTAHWGTIAIAGPKSRTLVSQLGLGVDLADDRLPHMAMLAGAFSGAPARVSRVSFIGERSYEISVPADKAGDLWQRARKLGAVPQGVEALSLLRAEKGFIIVGVDTDGESMPHDIGMGGPRDKRTDAYAGDRSLMLPVASQAGRKQLVGIAAEGEAAIPVGAHGVDVAAGRRSIGYITSSGVSPTLGRPVALALIADGRARMGQDIVFEHLGSPLAAAGRWSGRVVEPCFLDPKGERLHA